ncbi:MAG: type II toxin-antitoxin system RelE/ParE family toxin [Bacteroidales bacterium]
MKKYAVRITPSAQEDIYRIIDYIAEIYKAPLTAEKYLIELYDTIFSLENYAESISISTKSDILIHDVNARSVVFKKLTIVYSVYGDSAFVLAIIPSALIKS